VNYKPRSRGISAICVKVRLGYPSKNSFNRANSAACPKKDQLGNPRVGTYDIGAVEFQERRLVSVDV
jgi:hypothetical protein